MIASIIYAIVTGFFLPIIMSMLTAIQIKHVLFIVYSGFGIFGFFIFVVAGIYEIMAYFALPENIQQ